MEILVYYRTYLISTYSSYLTKMGFKRNVQSTSSIEFIQNIDLAILKLKYGMKPSRI